MATVAPNCGTPPESRTWPDNFPRLETGCLLDCARREGAPQVTPTAVPSRTPKHRRAPRFTLVYLPGVTFATVFGSTGFFTVKSAERETDTLASKSVALTSRVYFPGGSVARGKSLSMVT